MSVTYLIDINKIDIGLPCILHVLITGYIRVAREVECSICLEHTRELFDHC